MKKHTVKGLRIFMACILALVMIASVFPIQAAAAVELKITPDTSARTVRIKGDLSALGTDQVTLVITDPTYTGNAGGIWDDTDKIAVLKQLTLTDGKLDYTATLGEIAVKQNYRVFVNGALATATFQFPINVTGVSLNKESLTLVSGVFEPLTATIAPADASDLTVTWESDNAGVASVDAAGKIAANIPGTAVITVKTTDGSFTKTCAVTVLPDRTYTVETGKQLVLPIIARNCDGLSGLIASVEYDRALLTLESISASKGFMLLQKDDSFMMLSPEGLGLNGDTVIAYAVFTAKAELPEDQSSYVSFTVNRAVSASLENLTQTLPAAQVDILGIPPLPGDVNLDGEINVADAILLMQYLAGSKELSSTQLKAANVNKDGNVNVGDAVIIMQMCL